VRRDRICIVGAGAAGIAAAAAVSRAGLTFDCFEAGSSPGGIWRYGNDSGYSAYASLMSNTVVENMQWFGYRPAGMRNDYLSHREVFAYLTSFLEHADLMRHIQLRSRVTRIQPLAGGVFDVDIQGAPEQRTCRYTAVIIATGRHAKPHIPKIPGLERMAFMHSCNYRTPDVFAGKRIAIVGFGASGVDIACDAAGVAERVVLSTRHGGPVTPRYRDGKPTDAEPRAWAGRIPLYIRKQMRNFALRKWLISPERAGGLNRQRLSIDKPVVANECLRGVIRAGKVAIKPTIVEVSGDSVCFEDGTCGAFDLLVLASGYETAFPFFSDELLQKTAGFRDRYLRVIPAEPRNLFFIGQLSVAGPYFRVFERQALWIADILKGNCVLPSADRLRHLAAHDSKAAKRRFRHAAQPCDNVDYHCYMRSLALAHRKFARERLDPSG